MLAPGKTRNKNKDSASLEPSMLSVLSSTMEDDEVKEVMADGDTDNNDTDNENSTTAITQGDEASREENDNKQLKITQFSKPCVTTLDVHTVPLKARQFLIFTTPKPLEAGETLPTIQLQWHKMLKETKLGQLVIISNENLFLQSECAKHGIPVICIQHTDEGLPRFDLMMHRMHQAGLAAAATINEKEAVVAYVNSNIEIVDIKPLHGFLNTIHGQKFNIVVPTTPYQPYQNTTEETLNWFAGMAQTDISTKSRKMLHMAGYDLWAWNARFVEDDDGGAPTALLPFKIPPFRFPLAVYDQWLMQMVLQVAERAVLDISNLTPVFHHNPHSKKEDWYKCIQLGKTGIVMNYFLGYTEPSSNFTFTANTLADKYNHVAYWKHMGTLSEVPYVLKKKVGKDKKKDGNFGSYYMAKQTNWTPNNLQWNTGRCEQAGGCINLIEQRTTNERVGLQEMMEWIFSDVNTPAKAFLEKWNTTQQLHKKKFEETTSHWHYTMPKQLEMHSTPEKLVMVTAVTYEYRGHLMNFKCNLERVGMTDHFVIGALDKKMYKWGVLHGLPIFLVSGITVDETNESKNTGYGGDGFKAATKLKSRIVLEVLKAGYSAIWSDVDITWFSHPLKAMSKYVSPDFEGIAIQSNAPLVQTPEQKAVPHPSVDPVKTDAATGYRRLNSGLYIAKSNPLVVDAFLKIVEHARTSDKSEQPSFDFILCENPPSSRGKSSCTFRTNKDSNKTMAVVTLDRYKFPNGAVLVGPKNRNIYDLGKDRFEQYTQGRVAIAHNNWIIGHQAKKDRQLQRGWWFVEEDDDTFSCMYEGDQLILNHGVRSRSGVATKAQ